MRGITIIIAYADINILMKTFLHAILKTHALRVSINFNKWL